jgi:hypothetical protein
MPADVAAPASAPAPAAPSAPAPAASPAPASAPSSPAAPSAPSSGAPAGAPDSGLGAPAAPKEPTSLREKIEQGWKEVVSKTPEELEAEAAKASDAPPAEAPAEIPAAAVEEPKPGEAKPGDATPADAPAEAVQELDLGGGPVFGPKEFNDAITKDAAAKAYYDAHPEEKHAISAALRRSGDALKIAEHGIYPDNAPTIAKAAATFQSIDNHFLSAANDDGTPNPDGAKAFLSSWVKEAMMVGADGKPMMDANGKYQLHPAIYSIFDTIYGNKQDVYLQQMTQGGKLPAPLAKTLGSILDFYATQAQAQGDDGDRLLAGVNILREVSALSSPASGELPDQLKPFADSLKAKETALNERDAVAARQQQESTRTAHLQSIERAETKAADNAKAQLKPAFDKAGLSEFEATAAMGRIGDLIDQKLGIKNEDGTWSQATDSRAPLFQSVYDSILRQAPSDKREQALTKHILTYTNEILGTVAGEVLRMAKGGALDRQNSRQATVDAQTRTSRTEPHGTSVNPSGPQTKSPTQEREAIQAEYAKTHDGRKMPLSELLAEQFKRSTAQPQRI